MQCSPWPHAVPSAQRTLTPGGWARPAPASRRLPRFATAPLAVILCQPSFCARRLSRLGLAGGFRLAAAAVDRDSTQETPLLSRQNRPSIVRRIGAAGRGIGSRLLQNQTLGAARAGTVELRIPNLRKGSYFTSFLDPGCQSARNLEWSTLRHRCKSKILTSTCLSRQKCEGRPLVGQKVSSAQKSTNGVACPKILKPFHYHRAMA